MKFKISHNWVKVLSVFLAAFLLSNLIPNEAIYRTTAAPMSSFEIVLPSEVSGNVKIKLTNEANPNETKEEAVSSGSAVFTNFVEDQNTYTLSATGMIGYEDYTLGSLKLTGSSYNISIANLQKMQQITVSGSLVGTDGLAYTENAKVIYDGYESGSANIVGGSFSFLIYESQPYQLKIQTDDLKYDDIDLGTVNDSVNHDCGISTLTLKSYTITTQAGSHGSITPVNPTVSYNEGCPVTIVANDGYRISKVLVDGNAISAAVDKKNYTCSFTDVKENHTVYAEFAAKTYEVKLYYSQDGKINGSNQYRAINIPADSNFPLEIVPDSAFTLDKLVINGQPVASSLITTVDNTSTYSINSIGENYDVKVSFTQSQSLPIPATNYYSISPTDPIVTKTENKVTTYIYKKGTTVTLAPIPDYNRISVNSGNYQKTYTTSNSIYISSMNVLKNTVPYALGTVPIDSIQIVIDNDRPAINEITVPPCSGSSATVSGTVSDPSYPNDPSSGLSRVVWSTGFLDEANALAETTNCAVIKPDDGSFSFAITGEQDRDYYIYAIDVAGNISNAFRTHVKIDGSAPTIDKFAISKTLSTPSERVINFLSFGTFFNQQLLVAVTASDPGVSSGLKSITLYINGVPYITSDSLNGSSALFTIPAALLDNPFVYNYKLSAIATDNVGNETAVPVSLSTANSNAKSDSIMLENVKPISEITPDAAFYTDPEGDLWYGDDTGITIHAADLDSGIHSVSISINGKLLDVDAEGNSLDADYSTAKINEKSFTISTAEGVCSEDGTYLIEAVVIDNAGNEAKTDKTVYKDIVDPGISEFAFSPYGIEEADGKLTGVEVKDYGYYFKEATTVTISAADAAPSSGINSITYCTVDINGTRTEQTLNTVNDKISFVIPANFKGQIYAKAKDFVGNEPESYVTPYSVIIENSDLHSQEKHIAFTKESTSQKDANNLDLYSKDTNVLVTVSDTYSGLRRVEWSVIAPNDIAGNQSGTIEIGNSKQVSGNSDGWTQDKTDNNLVTQMSKTLTVTNNSNTIKVWVRITDRSGNVSENTLTFSIDKTAPTINISFDNNTADSTYKDFYKADRTATVVITERNFNPADVIAQISNTDKSVPTISSWTTKTDAADPDKTTHTATLLFATDGDYTFDVNYTDNAKNAAADYPLQAFTIDKTIPKASVSYNNNDGQNGNYYKADRTATVTIVEHNFDPSRIKIEGTATDNGKNVTFPSIGSWTSQGDVHTAQIQYTADARYTFDISGLDKTGNNIADYPQEQFFIDKTAPAISITGVADKSANNGDVVPVISYTDTNFDSNTVAISLAGSNRGSVKTDGTTAAQSSGGIFTFNNFEKTKENDDLYTLTATLTDLAGNVTTKVIVFSVNRFGSVYSLADSLKTIEGKYVKDAVDVVITETNVDSLKQDSIHLKMTYNGTPVDLVSGTDYTVAETGGDGEWSQYTYTINRDMFSGDGRYTVTLYSEDLAGNINENIDESKKAEISFGIDKTAPAIVSVDLDSNQQYPVATKTATFAIKDNLVLGAVKIYLDGTEVVPTIDGENYTINIGSQNQKQVVKIVSVDAAGNQSTLEIDNFLVTTNLFYRWINNTLLFTLSLIGIGVLILAFTVYMVFFRRRKSARREMHR